MKVTVGPEVPGLFVEKQDPTTSEALLLRRSCRRPPQRFPLPLARQQCFAIVVRVLCGAPRRQRDKANEAYSLTCLMTAPAVRARITRSPATDQFSM
jgi:hypothetical protein